MQGSLCGGRRHQQPGVSSPLLTPFEVISILACLDRNGFIAHLEHCVIRFLVESTKHGRRFAPFRVVNEKLVHHCRLRQVPILMNLLTLRHREFDAFADWKKTRNRRVDHVRQEDS